MSVQEIERRLELKKHVNLIHCSNNFSLVQRKMFNALLFNAYPDLASKNEFTIAAKTLCEITGYNSNDYKSLKKALLGLMTIAIEWNVIDSSKNTNDEKWRASSALSSARLDKGICTYEYSSVMKELFYQPEIYGRINIELLPKFKSSYGLALYENCIRYIGIPQTPWLSLDVFRKLMGVFEDRYPIFRDLKRRVIDVAIKEVNLYSSIVIVPEYKRLSKQVVGIRFLLKSKPKSELSSDNIVKKITTNNDGLINVLKDTFNLSEKSIEGLFSKYESDYLFQKVNFILNSDSFCSGKIRELSGYLIEALKKDYKETKSSKEIIREQSKRREIEETIKKQETDRLQNEYRKYLSLITEKLLSELDEGEIKSSNLEFDENLKKQGGFLYKWYQKSGLNHPAINTAFNDFIRKKHLEQGGSILNFEEFSKLKPMEILEQ